MHPRMQGRGRQRPTIYTRITNMQLRSVVLAGVVGTAAAFSGPAMAPSVASRSAVSMRGPDDQVSTLQRPREEARPPTGQTPARLCVVQCASGIVAQPSAAAAVHQMGGGVHPNPRRSVLIGAGATSGTAVEQLRLLCGLMTLSKTI